MDIAHILRDILIVLVAAKLAAEGAERLALPAVVGEILAGVLVGPSLLGIVGRGDEVLRTLGEIGVILLLLDVGLEMDLDELSKVGRASLNVAVIGVAAPLLGGLGAMGLIGASFNTSLFVAAALTATSVGITARVIGDLRALAATEARVVLGAAVADDVMGLVVLTVVVRLVTHGSVSIVTVLGIVGIAIGFLVVSATVGIRVAPILFGVVERNSRSTGTLVALALAFTLGFAELADAAKLAPIVGAFVAGIALTRCRQRERIRRELTPVGHLFIPVFFLQIGIDADVSAFARVSVLRDAAVLLAVAIVGKLIASVGATGTRADRWLIGIGMLPRGEVGLIFATIGLQNQVLGQDLYAALLLVVLVTTLMTPQLLKMRFATIRSRHELPNSSLPLATEPPRGGWVRVVDGRVHLAAMPPGDRALAVALDAALEMAHARPSSELIDYLSASSQSAKWDQRAGASLRKVVEQSNPRAWRFLEAIGVLDRALPELAETLRARHADPLLLDGDFTHRWGALERLRSLPDSDPLRAQFERLDRPERVLLAALLVEGLESRPRPGDDAANIARRVGLDREAEAEIIGLVLDDGLLRSAAAQIDALGEEQVLQLASHLDTPERARATFLLACVRDDTLATIDRERLTTLHELIQRALSDPDLTGSEARNLIERRRTEAMLLVREHRSVVERIRKAPRAYVARQPSDVIARHALLSDPPIDPARVRVVVTPIESTAGIDARWTVEVAGRDRPGLMAAVTGALGASGLEVDRSVVATWGDDMAIESFVVTADHTPDASELEEQICASLGRAFEVAPVNDATIEFDDVSSPWHTVCEITAPDFPGLLHGLCSVFAAAQIDIKAASIGHADGRAVDRFELVGRNPRLSEQERTLVRSHLAHGATARPRRFRTGFVVSGPVASLERATPHR